MILLNPASSLLVLLFLEFGLVGSSWRSPTRRRLSRMVVRGSATRRARGRGGTWRRSFTSRITSRNPSSRELIRASTSLLRSRWSRSAAACRVDRGGKTRSATKLDGSTPVKPPPTAWLSPRSDPRSSPPNPKLGPMRVLKRAGIRGRGAGLFPASIGMRLGVRRPGSRASWPGRCRSWERFGALFGRDGTPRSPLFPGPLRGSASAPAPAPATRSRCRNEWGCREHGGAGGVS